MTALAVAWPCAVGHATPQAEVGAAASYRSGKSSFVEALATFTTAMAGTYGDEGPALRASLDAMEGALERWDASIAAYEAAVRDGRPGLDAHVKLAAVYLDRGLPMRALPELEAAVRLAPSQPDLHAFLGLAHGLLGDHALAAQAYEHAAQLDPGEPALLYELALRLRAGGRVEEAGNADRRFRTAQHARLFATGAAEVAPAAFTRPALLRARGATPVFPLALYADGFRLLRAGAYASAIEALRRGAGIDPLTAGPDAAGERATARGSAALRRGALRDALEQLTSAVESAPGDPEAARLLGMAHWADERHDRAAAHLRAAVALRPEDERARLALADVLVTAGRTEAAEHVLLEAVEVLPGAGQVRFRLGRLYHLTGRYQEAIAAFEQATSLEPFVGLDGLYRLIGLTRALEQDVEGTIRAYRRQIDVTPDDASIHRALGDTLLEDGRYEAAHTAYLAALLVDPRDARAAGQVARIHLEQREYADAVAAARYALRIDDDREARYALATGLMRLGRVEEGRAALQAFGSLQQAEMARERDAYELDALRREAVLSLERGEFPRAIDLRREMVTRQPGVAGAHADLGEALLRAGRILDAIASFERALALDPAADVHRRLAEAYGSLGRTGKRREHLEAHERAKEARLRAGAFR
jgi:tetratricopeptide (TPR) repeat protein